MNPHEGAGAVKTQFTWAWVAKGVATAPFDKEVALEAWGGLKALSGALLALMLRAVMLSTFPVSVPLLVYGFRWGERLMAKKREAATQARRAAQDADV